MRRADKELWLTALRSGLYQQGISCLTKLDRGSGERHCCLGVVCVVLNVPRVTLISDTAVRYGDLDGEGGVHNSISYLPKHIADHLGIERRGKLSFEDRNDNPVYLSSLNDERMPFSQIADLIEYDYETED